MEIKKTQHFFFHFKFLNFIKYSTLKKKNGIRITKTHLETHENLQKIFICEITRNKFRELQKMKQEL